MGSHCCQGPFCCGKHEHSWSSQRSRNLADDEHPDGKDSSPESWKVAELADFSLSPFDLNNEAQCYTYLQMMRHVGLTETFQLRDDVILGYAGQVLAKYRDVPYHNGFHGFSITQFLFTAYTKSSLLTAIFEADGGAGMLDLLAMFSAVLAHDVDHPGNNNAFEVASKTALALKYSDKAVLENHHSAVAFQILSDSATDMFGTLSTESRANVQQAFVHAVLMTDMAQHFKMVDDVKSLLEKQKAGGIPYKAESAEDRRELVGTLVHAADISNPLLPSFSLARQWAERITQEFTNQYRMEVKASLEPTKMWANLDDPVAFYKSQVGFIDFIVSPLWNTVIGLFPDLQEKGRLLDGLKANKERWAQLASEEEAKEVEVEAAS